jgi:hypothetical protein
MVFSACELTVRQHLFTMNIHTRHHGHSGRRYQSDNTTGRGTQFQNRYDEQQKIAWADTGTTTYQSIKFMVRGNFHDDVGQATPLADFPHPCLTEKVGPGINRPAS